MHIVDDDGGSVDQDRGWQPLPGTLPRPPCPNEGNQGCNDQPGRRSDAGGCGPDKDESRHDLRETPLLSHPIESLDMSGRHRKPAEQYVPRSPSVDACDQLVEGFRPAGWVDPSVGWIIGRCSHDENLIARFARDHTEGRKPAFLIVLERDSRTCHNPKFRTFSETS